MAVLPQGGNDMFQRPQGQALSKYPVENNAFFVYHIRPETSPKRQKPILMDTVNGDTMTGRL